MYVYYLDPFSCYLVFRSAESPYGSSWDSSRTHCVPISIIPPLLRQYAPQSLSLTLKVSPSNLCGASEVTYKKLVRWQRPITLKRYTPLRS